MPSTPTPRLPYAAALDGLRALAVAAVLGYHLDISWMRGGFLGVDLFFVISGFLITRLLLGEYAASGRIALGAFWIRRFRRLVPPLVVVVAASIAATRLWGVPAQWDAMRSDAIASLAYVANWHFILNDTSYFETLLGPSPLRHVWSLAVEEQWYLIWPLIMVALEDATSHLRTASSRGSSHRSRAARIAARAPRTRMGISDHHLRANDESPTTPDCVAALMTTRTKATPAKP